MSRTMTRLAVTVVVLTLAAFVLGGWYQAAPPVADGDLPREPAAILAELKAGNLRYVAGARTRSADTRRDAERRRQLAEHGQHPAVALLTCADSRICPEFIFDQPIGVFFDMRNAGNVVDDDVMASLEYAAEHLPTPVVLVMGHKGCGAIAAVNEAGDKELPRHLDSIQAHMAGLRETVRQGRGERSATFLNRLSTLNARQQAALAQNGSEIVRAAVKARKMTIVVAMYDLATGAVEFLDGEST